MMMPMCDYYVSNCKHDINLANWLTLTKIMVCFNIPAGGVEKTIEIETIMDGLSKSLNFNLSVSIGLVFMIVLKQCQTI